MSDTLLVKADDGQLRIARRSDIGEDGRLKPRKGLEATQPEGGRTIEDVIDISAGLRRADDIRAAQTPEEAMAMLEAGSKEIKDNMSKFGVLLHGARRPFDRAGEALRLLVTDIMSGPHPAKQAPDERQSFFAKLSALIGGGRHEEADD